MVLLQQTFWSAGNGIARSRSNITPTGKSGAKPAAARHGFGSSQTWRKGMAFRLLYIRFLGNIMYQGAVTYPPFAVIRHFVDRHAALKSRNGCIRLISARQLWFLRDLSNINEARPALTIPRAILRSLSVGQ
jgi:hypothetical protein